MLRALRGYGRTSRRRGRCGIGGVGRWGGVAGVVGGVDGDPSGLAEQQLTAAMSGVEAGEDRLLEVVWSPASTARIAHRDAVLPGVRIRCAPTRIRSWRRYVRTHRGAGGAAVLAGRAEAGVLVVATRGAVAVAGEDVTDLAGAAVWGLVRSAQTEHPGRIVLVDSDVPLDDTTIAAALAAGEPQVLRREGQVYTARALGSRAVDGVLVPPGDGPWRLGISNAGTFENLRLEPIPNAGAPLQPGQVRVALPAIAANFRDIMITLGMFTHDALIGGEGAGVVVEVGPGWPFRGRRPGYGFFPDGTGTLVTADLRLLVKVPADWSYAEPPPCQPFSPPPTTRSWIWPTCNRGSGC